MNDGEFEGYQAACPEGVKLVAIRVAPEGLGLRLYRAGTRPVLRGKFWQVTPKRGFLWHGEPRRRWRWRSVKRVSDEPAGKIAARVELVNLDAVPEEELR